MNAVDALPILLPLALLVSGVVAALAGLWRSGAAQVVALVGAGGGAVLAGLGAVTVARTGEIRHDLGGWPPPLGIEYVLDPLSAFMALVITLIGFAVVVYPAVAGFGHAPGRGSPLYSLTLLLLAGLLGVVMSGDLFNLFVFLEVYALATYALIALGGDRATFATLRYLIFGTIGSGFYLLGVGFVYFTTGTLNMADAAARLGPLADSPTIIGAAVLIVVGLGVKMALFPLHVWLPDAHSYAPPAVAALLAAVQVKAAAYALVRILYGVFPAELVLGGVPILRMLAYFGAAGVVVGSVMAIRQTDLKRLLAYSTVAQLGFIGLGIGLANPVALVGALLHVLNHAVMKSCLFLVAGGVLAETGLKAIPRFSGLGRRMPFLMGGFAIAALSMVGIPPTAGFFSKFYILLGSLEAGDWVLAVIIVTSSLLTAVYFLKVFERVFTGEADETVQRAAEPGGRVLGPVLALAGAVLVIGLGNVAIVNGLLDPMAAQLLPAG
jgi:multicomponent Na+:H+ antiporter subunit D